MLACETGVLLVLTDRGALRATYGAPLLGLLARDRTATPEPGEWVLLRRWCDGPVTVEEMFARRPEPPLADVVHLRPDASLDR